MDGYQVVTQALRNEAPKWDEFGERVAQVRGQVESATLDVLAFFVGDPVGLGMKIRADMHRDAYERLRSFVESVLRGAETEFPQLGDALIEIATRYEDAEQLVVFNLNEVYKA